MKNQINSKRTQLFQFIFIVVFSSMLNAQWTQMGPGAGGQERAIFQYTNPTTGQYDFYVGSDVSGVWRAANVDPNFVNDPDEYQYEFISNHEPMRFVTRFYRPTTYNSNFLFVNNRSGIDKVDLNNFSTPMTSFAMTVPAPTMNVDNMWVSDLHIGLNVGATTDRRIYFVTSNTGVSDGATRNHKDVEGTDAVFDFCYGTIDAGETNIDLTGANNGGLFFNFPTPPQQTDPPFDDDVFCLYVDEKNQSDLNDDEFLVGTQFGMYHFSGNDFLNLTWNSNAHLITPPSSMNTAGYQVTSIQPAPNGEFFITINNGETGTGGIFTWSTANSWQEINAQALPLEVPYPRGKLSNGTTETYVQKMYNQLLPLKNNGIITGYLVINEDNIDDKGTTSTTDDVFFGVMYSPANVGTQMPIGEWTALDAWGANEEWGWNKAKPCANPWGALVTQDNCLMMGKSGNIFKSKAPITSDAGNHWQQIYTHNVENIPACNSLYRHRGYVNTLNKCVYPINDQEIWIAQLDRVLFYSNNGGYQSTVVPRNNTNAACSKYMDLPTGSSTCTGNNYQFTDCFFVTQNNRWPADPNFIYAGVAEGFASNKGRGIICTLPNATADEWVDVAPTSSICGDPVKMLFGANYWRFAIFQIDNPGNGVPFHNRLFYLNASNQWIEVPLFGTTPYNILDAVLSPNGKELYIYNSETNQFAAFTNATTNATFWSLVTTPAMPVLPATVTPQKMAMVPYNNNADYTVMCGTVPTSSNTSDENLYPIFTFTGLGATLTTSNASLTGTGNLFNNLNHDAVDHTDEGITAFEIDEQNHKMYVATMRNDGSEVRSHLYWNDYNSTTGAIDNSWVEITGFPNKTVIYLKASGNIACNEKIFSCLRGLGPWVHEYNPVTIVPNSLHNVSCVGGNDGQVTVSPPLGFTGTVSYSWNTLPPQTSATATGLAAGTYTVTVSDGGSNCTSSLIIEITEPHPLTVKLQATPVSCYQASDGQLTALPVGGTASFTYLWSNSATTQTINGLAVGTYTVTVTDAHGCPATKSITITQPTQLAPTCSGTNVNCFGGNNGSATVTATGGTAPYTYLWSNGKTTAANNNIAAGTYTATVTDANGCTATCAYTVTQPTQLVATCAGTNLNCFGGNNGSATVTASGGIAPYTYLWNTNAATSTLTSLPTGTYIVTVTDDNGCTATSYVIIAQPAQLTISFSQTNLPGCIGSNFGVNTVVTGGTQPFTYNWSNGANTANLTNLDPNIQNYTLFVSDANGCSMLEPFTLQNDNTCCGIFTNNFSTTNGNPPAFTENLNADLVVNGTLTLTNSTLDIYSGVKIILDDASDVLTLDACYLYACSNMWQGIINNGGTVNVINGTIIEDAQEALRTTGNGTANIKQSIFNHNFKNLIFENGDYSNAIIWGNTFDCTDAYTGLKAPHIGERTNNYIELNNVTNIKIGDETQLPNTFNTATSFGADRGVTGKLSTATIYNNVFNSFDTDADQTNTKGQAIFMDGDDGIPYSIPTNNAIIGNINIVNSGNIFSDCKVAIELQKQNASVEENNIVNNPQPLATMPFVQGVYVHDGFKFNVTIRHNKIINSDKGVCIDALNNVYGTVNIVDDNHLDCKPTTTNVYSAAVRIADVNATHSESAGYLIANNKNDALDEIDQGIHSTGMYGINIMNVFTTIKENIVYLDASNYTKMKTGIKTENGLMPTIICNQIKGYDVNDITMRTAISTEFSAMTTLECNITHRAEIGIDFVSDCNFSVIKGNSMFYHTIGFQLGAKFNGGNSWSTGIIGDQATYQNGNNTYTLGNRFYGTNGNGAFGFSSMHSINSNASFNQWIFVNNLSHKPPLPPYTSQVVGNYVGIVSAFSPIFAPNITLSYTCDNTCVVTHPDPHRTQLENEINGIIYGDTTTNSASDVLLYYSRTVNVIGETNRDSSLADSSTIIADFIAAQQSTFLGKMLKAEEIINLLLSNNGNATSLKTLALDLLDDVPPQYIFEQNALDLVMLILNHNGVIDGRLLNQADRQIVESIAHQCPFKGGKAVYRARAIVWTYNPAMIFDNDDLCNDGAFFRNGIMPSNYAFYVAPNPTNENTIFYYQLQDYDNVNLQIVDVDGKVISTVDLDTKKAHANLDVVNFANGIYTIKILARGSLIGCARIVIIK